MLIMAGLAFAQEEPEGEADESYEFDGGQWIVCHGVCCSESAAVSCASDQLQVMVVNASL
ncbi:MAG: hypothetical protein VBE63_03165 [Lamprobacter sp.]|uniref:hypothetical protein n=1 Tax=Lamprobacter sp. TaxID=3100796 RepID=UPI002B258BF3|nr:hypothetical protein [Lamprobacter sp.]MEA3638927.1 hypothetical protein [Lamprobacter sp.]